MRIDIVTLFPAMVEPALATSMLGRARARGLVDIRVVDLPDYATGKPRVTRDYQFGRGRGNVRESCAACVLEPPKYTRHEEFRGARVPEVLLSGDHARVARWRREQALWLTWRRRPELLAEASLTDEERRLIEQFERGEAPPAPARTERDEGHGRDSHR